MKIKAGRLKKMGISMVMFPRRRLSTASKSRWKTKMLFLLALVVTSLLVFHTDFQLPKGESYFRLVRRIIDGTGRMIVIGGEYFGGDLKLRNVYKDSDKVEERTNCEIPSTPVMPEYFQIHWKPNSKSAQDKHDCSYEQNVAQLTDEQTLTLLPPFFDEGYECCLQEISRGPTDFLYNFTDCKQIEGTMVLGEKMEAFAVKCGKSTSNSNSNAKFESWATATNVDTAIPIKPAVEKKINFWRKFESEKGKRKPMSVLFFGFDSVSRAHAYRSIPRTIDVMKKMGFVDMEGYHSVAPSTLTNFMAFLMGMTRTEVRLTCAPDWTAPFDNCPFIWKEFNDHNYITSYIEDGLQTFNWGGQSGFVDKPCDYYLHHLFLALQDLRKVQVANFHLDPRKKNLTLDCTSREKIPEFLLRYTRRFLEKFGQTPFFSFTWFAYPFHEDIYSLYRYDDQLVSFYRFIQDSDLLKNTVIIMLSDHGDRTSFFNSKSIESYIERGFPPLFIRLPDDLVEEHPQMLESLKFNSKLLTTPFDVHQTLKHILAISTSNELKVDSISKSNLKESSGDRKRSGQRNGNKKEKPFTPQVKDRSSLLVKLSPSRTCEDTNIPPTNCLCNVQYRSQNSTQGESQGQVIPGFKSNDKFAHKLLKFSIAKLNAKVSKSEYREDCEKWTSNPGKDIIYTKIISQTEENIQVIIAFTANPGLAKFECRLKVKLSPVLTDKGSKTEEMQVVGFSRINQYGTQSWCVKSMTDSDKEMKEICMCRMPSVPG